jgi:hypothetical protein
VPRNEDDRHVGPIAGDAHLEIDTIETWKRNVKCEAAWNKDSWAAEKFLCRREYYRLPAFALNPQVQDDVPIGTGRHKREVKEAAIKWNRQAVVGMEFQPKLPQPLP